MTPSETQKKVKLNIAYLNSHFSKKPDKIQKPKSKIGDKERLSKFYKNLFHKGYTQNWNVEIFVVNSIEPTTPVTEKNQ